MNIKRFEFNMFPVNCYVLWDDTREAVVIDAGCYYPEEQQRLKDFLVNNGLQLKPIFTWITFSAMHSWNGNSV